MSGASVRLPGLLTIDRLVPKFPPKSAIEAKIIANIARIANAIKKAIMALTLFKEYVLLTKMKTKYAA